MPELLLVSQNSGDFAILLELEGTVGTLGSVEVVLVYLVEFRQDLAHGWRSHEREPGVGTIFGVLFGESTKEEPAEHGTKSRVLRRPHTIVVTPGGEVVRSKIGCEESISTNESDCICKNGPGDGVTRAETSTRDDWFGLLGLETSVELEMVDCAIKFLGSSSDLRVGIPFQERRVWFQTEVLQKRQKLGRRCRSHVLTFLKSFKEQQPHLLADSIPITSIHLMLAGVPRAPNVAAGCSVLYRAVGLLYRSRAATGNSLCLQDVS